MSVDELQIEINAKAAKANQSIDTLVWKLGRLNASLSRLNSSSLIGLANGVDRLGRAMQSMNAVKTTDFTRLAKNLEKMGSINTASLNATASSMSHLSRAFNNLGAVSSNAIQISEIAKNIGKLGNANVQRAIVNMPQLAVALNNLMTTLSKTPQVSQNLIQMTNALANLSSQGNKVSTATNAMTTGIKRTYVPMKTAKKHTMNLASTIGLLYAKYFLVLRAIRLFNKALTSTANYIEAYNYMNVALGKIGSDWKHQYEEYGYDNADAYADSFADRMQEKIKKLSGLSIEVDAEGNGLLTETGMKNLGLNIQEVTQYASQLASVTNSVGQTGEVSLATSTALTRLGADMSSLFNLDYSQVMGNLQSGLAGQSRALYKYGIDITNASLQTTAYALGITKAVSEMSQMEKQQLRIIKILQDSRVAWGDLANTIDSPSNMIRVFKNNLKETGMVLGQLFTPALQGILPILNGVTIAIKRLLVNMAGLFGIKLEFQKYGEGFMETEDDAEELTDGIEGATEALKEYKNQALDFDEINPLKELDTSSASASGSGNTIDLTDQIIKETEEYEKVWEEAYKQMESTSQNIADRISSAFSKAFASGGWYGVGNLISSSISKSLEDADWDSINETLVEIAEGIAGFINGLFTPELLGNVGTTFAKSLNAVINSKKTLGENINFKQVGEAIGTGVNNFFSTFDFEQLGKSISTWVDGIAEALTEAIATIDWYDVFKGLWEFVSNLSAKTIAILSGLAALKMLGGGSIFGGLGALLGFGATGGGGGGTGTGGTGGGTTILPWFTKALAVIGAAAGGGAFGNWLGRGLFGDDEYYDMSASEIVAYLWKNWTENPEEVGQAASDLSSDLSKEDSEINKLSSAIHKPITDGIDYLIGEGGLVDKADNILFGDWFDNFLSYYGLSTPEPEEKVPVKNTYAGGLDENALAQIDDWDAFMREVHKETAVKIGIEWALGGKTIDFLGIGEEMQKKGASIAWNIAQGILGDKSSKSAMSALVQGIKDVLGGKSDTVVSFAKNFGISVVKFLGAGIQGNTSAKTAVESVVNNVKSAIGNNTIIDTALAKGKSIVWNLGKGITDGKATATTPLTNVITAMINTISNSNLFEKFKQVGKYIVDGIISGINDPKQTASLANTMVNLGTDVITSFTDFMQIHSPSRLFMKYGQYTVEGYNLGIQKYAPNTSDVMTDWTNAIADTDMTYNNTTTVSRDEEVMLLRQQNQLLQALLNKDTNVEIKADSKSLFKVVQKQANDYTIQTGQPAFAL